MNDLSKIDLLEKLGKGFLEDIPGRIDLIESEVMSSGTEDSYDELFRMVHSLKGSAGTFNFHIITKIAHDMEDVMLALMQRELFSETSTQDILLKFIDILRDTTDSLIENNTAPADVNERLELLSKKIFHKNISVLIVEHSKVYTSLIEYTLENLPIKFTVVYDGMEALENLLLNSYDLLITSLESPRLNGDALVAALRLMHNFNKDINVVLITSRSKDNIANLNDFDSILDPKEVKDGSLNEIVKKLISEQ